MKVDFMAAGNRELKVLFNYVDSYLYEKHVKNFERETKQI